MIKIIKHKKTIETVKKTYSCDWCGKFVIETEPIIGGKHNELKFCSFSCLENQWDHTHDNWYSDADSGL